MHRRRSCGSFGWRCAACYTFVVVALLIAVLGAVSIYRMSTDIFPVGQHPRRLRGLAVHRHAGRRDREPHHPRQRARADRLRQRHRTHREPVARRRRRHPHLLPPGREDRGRPRPRSRPPARRCSRSCRRASRRPYIVQYSATSVPIVQIAVSSDTLTEQQIFDYAQNFIIQQLGTVQGARVPQPYGGKQRQVMVELDPNQLYARGLSPQECGHGRPEPEPDHPGRAPPRSATRSTTSNSTAAPTAIQGFNDLPVKTVNGVPVYVKDVAHVPDGFAVQTNVVRRDGRRAVLMTVLKAEGASTINVVQRLARPCRPSRPSCRRRSRWNFSSISRCSCRRPSRACSRRGPSPPG